VKVVLDTNVLMSGIFFGGVPGRILAAWAGGALELVLSPDILEEYRRVGTELSARYPERGHALTPILALVAMNAILVDAGQLSELVSVDPADDKFLAAARMAGATIVVSGDRDLLDVSGWQGIAVLSPRQFAGRHLPPG